MFIFFILRFTSNFPKVSNYVNSCDNSIRYTQYLETQGCGEYQPNNITLTKVLVHVSFIISVRNRISKNITFFTVDHKATYKKWCSHKTNSVQWIYWFLYFYVHQLHGFFSLSLILTMCGIYVFAIKRTPIIPQQQSPLTCVSAAPPQFTRNPINNYYLSTGYGIITGKFMRSNT